jgi:pimeloyl-ACP methyl ester carboxylesterase
MHSLNNWHNEFNATNAYPELAERRGAIGITPLALGVDGWYWDEALVDALQAWKDVRDHFGIDPDRTSIGGYSMGGYATYRLTTLLPDRFAAAAMWAGVPAYEIWPYPAEPVPTGDRTAPGKTWSQLENTEHIPFLVAHGTNDELVPVAGVVAQTERMHELGHEYQFNLHPGQDHFTFTALDDFSAQGVWLRDHPQRVRVPGHVGFKVRPWSWVTTSPDGASDARIPQEIASLGYDLRSAYWVSGVQVGDGTDPVGVVDLTSHAVALRTPVTSERLGAEATGSSPHTVRGLYRTEVAAPIENRLSGSLSGVTSLTVDLAASGLHLAGLAVDVTTDRPVTVRFVDGPRSETRVLAPST